MVTRYNFYFFLDIAMFCKTMHYEKQILSFMIDTRLVITMSLNEVAEYAIVLIKILSKFVR